MMDCRPSYGCETDFTVGELRMQRKAAAEKHDIHAGSSLAHGCGKWTD
jgi:hypothetical protein